METNGGAAETTTYGFDDADRLTAVTYPDKKVTYTYDGVGNRLMEVTKALLDTLTSSKTFTYDDRNRLASVTDSANPAADTTFEYDANGNQTRRLLGGVPTEFHYDVRDKLIEVDRAGTLLETYLYDYQGFRVRKSGIAARGDRVLLSVPKSQIQQGTARVRRPLINSSALCGSASREGAVRLTARATVPSGFSIEVTIARRSGEPAAYRTANQRPPLPPTGTTTPPKLPK